MALLQESSFATEDAVNSKQKLLANFQSKVEEYGGFVGTLIGGKSGILEALQQLDPQALEPSEEVALSTILNKMASSNKSDSDDVAIAQELVKQINLSANSNAGEKIKLNLMIRAAHTAYANSARDIDIYDTQVIKDLAKLDGSKLRPQETDHVVTALEGTSRGGFDSVKSLEINAMVNAINSAQNGAGKNTKMDILMAYLRPGENVTGAQLNERRIHSGILSELNRLDAGNLSTSKINKLKDVVGLMSKIPNPSSNDTTIMATFITEANQKGGASEIRLGLMAQTLKAIYGRSATNASFEDRHAIETLGVLGFSDLDTQKINDLNTLFSQLHHHSKDGFSSAEIATLRNGVSQVTPTATLPGVNAVIYSSATESLTESKAAVLSNFLAATGRTKETLTVAQLQIFNILSNLDPSKLNQNEANKLAGIASRIGTVPVRTANNRTYNAEDMEIMRALVNEANRTSGRNVGNPVDEAKFSLMLETAEKIYGSGTAPAANATAQDRAIVSALAKLDASKSSTDEITILQEWVSMLSAGYKTHQIAGHIATLVSTANETLPSTSPNFKLDLLDSYMRQGANPIQGIGAAKGGIIAELRKIDAKKFTSTQATMFEGLLSIMGRIRSFDRDDLAIVKTLVDEVNKSSPLGTQQTLKLGLMMHSVARLYAAQEKGANYDDRKAVEAVASLDAKRLGFSETLKLTEQFGTGIAGGFDLNEVNALRTAVDRVNSSDTKTLGELPTVIGNALTNGTLDVAAGDSLRLSGVLNAWIGDTERDA